MLFAACHFVSHKAAKKCKVVHRINLNHMAAYFVCCIYNHWIWLTDWPLSYLDLFINYAYYGRRQGWLYDIEEKWLMSLLLHYTSLPCGKASNWSYLEFVWQSYSTGLLWGMEYDFSFKCRLCKGLVRRSNIVVQERNASYVLAGAFLEPEVWCTSTYVCGCECQYLLRGMRS